MKEETMKEKTINNKTNKRQTVRRMLILISFLLFPVTIWYFSPYLIIQAASEHIMNGSFIVFSAMFILSIFLGRVWCGYLCPAGGLQECAMRVKDNAAKAGWRNNIKFVIWILWMAGVVTTFVLGKNDYKIDFFYMTDHGISITEVYNYVIYYGVILLLVAPALIHGRRAACHYICWMAPFMIIGSKIGQLLHVPQLHMEADKSKCVSCKKCDKACPMGLSVNEMVLDGGNGHCSECIQCGACADTCPNGVINYTFKWNGEKL